MTSHIGDVSSGTDEGARIIRIPSPPSVSVSGTSMAAFGGSSFWAAMTTATTDNQVALITPSAHQHHHQCDARTDAAEPEAESGVEELAVAPAEELLEPFTVTKTIGCIYLAAIPDCTRSRDHGRQSTLLTKVPPPLTSRTVPVT